MAAVPPDAPPRFQQVATNVYQVSEKVGRKAATASVGFGTRLHAWLLAFLAIWTPLRLILLGCVGVCAATIAYTLLVDRSEQAVLDLKAANEAARDALAQGDVDAAYDHFSVAVLALDKLERRDDPLAREIRQLHRETTALREAMPISPLQVVSEADAAYEDGQGDQWQQRFRAQYRKRWLIVDAVVRQTTPGADRGKYIVSIPLRVGPKRRAIQFHPAVSELDPLFKGGKPRNAIFAVQVVGCGLSPDKTTWRLQTDSDSAFLWGTIDNYVAAGFQLETPEARRQIEQVLAAQQRVLGLMSPEIGPDAEVTSVVEDSK